MPTKKEHALHIIKKLGIINNTSKDDPMVEKLESKGSIVYHQIQGTYILGGYDTVKMTSYLLLTKEDLDDMLWLEKNLKDGYHFSYTINHTWNIEEYGSIMANVTKATGLLRRTG